MIGIVLIISLSFCLMEIQMALATSCYFSRSNQASPTGWIDVIDECKENETDAICFSGLRKKLACSSDEEVPAEGCYRDKIRYENFFLCWCAGSKCNTREKITEIYKTINTTYVVDGDCKPFNF
ncbi:unnamed protein product [Cercopithifilaria johnstoni]|uniref:Plethodontid modulating factor n=1 Tax=Cercopithifilaria johnstoni TaxID=2874296 RepID=A0A8J2LWI6_9BILA|nr:unnamed protein product [Cercopithifilaria johnstoni]